MAQRIPFEFERLMREKLEAHEQVQWQGMPTPHYFSASSSGAFLFAIPWTAFAIFWMFGASQSGSIAFTSFGIPFVLIGIAMLLTPVWNYRKSLKTLYVITKQRAISFVGGRSMTVRSFQPEHLRQVFRRERRDGSGDVILMEKEWTDSDGDKQRKEHAFIRIKDVKKVEGLLKALAHTAHIPDAGLANPG